MPLIGWQGLLLTLEYPMIIPLRACTCYGLPDRRRYILVSAALASALARIFRRARNVLGSSLHLLPPAGRYILLSATFTSALAVRMGYSPAFRQPRSVTFMIILLFQYSHDVSGRSGPGFRRFRPKENSGRSAGVLCH